MPRLLVATTNPNKVREIRQLLDGLPFDLVTLAGWPAVTAPEETGQTFEENALDGAPGVESARFGGVETSYPDKFALIYDLLAARSAAGALGSAARFVCA